MAWRFDRVWQHDRPYQWPARHRQAHQRATAGSVAQCQAGRQSYADQSGRDDPLYGSLRGVIRSAVFDHIVRADPAASFIFTDALSDDAYDTRQFDAYRELTDKRRARLVSVVLDCSEEENARRLVMSGRVERLKLTYVTTLRSLRAEHRLLRDRTCELFEIDATTLSPEDVAQKIAGMVVAGRG